MKPLFKNTTKYNEENYNKFVKFHEKKFSFSYNAYNIIMMLLILYCIISTIKDKNIFLCLCFWAMLIAFILIRIYIPIRRTQKTQAEYSENKENSYTFSFYKNYFVIATNRFYYIRMHKIFETDEYYYLYLDEENAFLISKSGFEIGTPEEFSKFIKKKCIFKYSKQA